MSEGDEILRKANKSEHSILLEVRRAFRDFLLFPTLVVLGFLILGLLAYAIDRVSIPPVEAVRNLLGVVLFTEASTVRSFLSTIATGLITVTSITVSILLLAVQQSSATLTFQVIDQFLRRRLNQFTFGFFVGLSIYSLLILSSVDPSFVPVIGEALAFLLTIGALYLLLVLLYTTLNQMRPATIIEAIHDHALSARKRQLSLLRKTRRSSQFGGNFTSQARIADYGFVTGIDLDSITAAIDQARGKAEVVLRAPIGAFLAFGSVAAEVKAERMEDLAPIEKAVKNALTLENNRDPQIDPAYNILQIANIAWTSMSTAKDNPAPGILAIRFLSDLVARWSIEDELAGTREDAESPVVYPDTVFAELLEAFESLAVVASESMQHQSFAEIVSVYADIITRIPSEYRDTVESAILRILSALGDEVPTTQLDRSLTALVGTLHKAGREDAAAAVEAAQDKLDQSIGKLASRSTRANRG